LSIEPQLALSVISSLGVRFPEPEGVNVTPIVQVPPAATEAPQVFAISAKPPAFVPVNARPAMFKVAPVPLLSVIV